MYVKNQTNFVQQAEHRACMLEALSSFRSLCMPKLRVTLIFLSYTYKQINIKIKKHAKCCVYIDACMCVYINISMYTQTNINTEGCLSQLFI